MLARSLRALAPFLIPALGAMACATAEELPPQPSSGGQTATSGGSSGNDSGGMATSGGASSGGTSTTSGGATSGGAVSSGGSTSKGGATSSGGSTSKGGATSSGGATSDLPYNEDFETPVDDRWIVADTNGTWSQKQVDGSQAYVVVAADKSFSVGGNVGWKNVRVEAKVRFEAVGSSPIIYVMGRWADTKSYLVLEFRPGDSNGDLKLRQTDGGSTDDLCRYKPAAVTTGKWYTIGFSVNGGMGSEATLLFNGMPVTADKPCLLTKANPTAGGIALGADDATAAFDDVSVKVP